ncbi:MAG TPA: TIGR03067 domain-containing protein [Gemmataceae bacterium]|nr:TIGR03067 domain-containing protein [Gemmataceae bacterium]
MRCVLPFVLLSLGFAPAPVPKPKAAEEDLKRMQGSWVLIFIVQDGERENIKGKVTWEIKGNRVSTTTEDGKAYPPFFMALDANSTPRAIDIRDSPRESPRLLGRYSVDRNTLKVSIGEKRPADLSGNNAEFGVWVFKHQRP